ncbi:mitochondrial carrier domain-containing protein [Leucosporidium creatinivorum]|uniref:Mitochondrial carrier domain-containing protein n=1 Tax=Leucosporidium creatinivorum TaxID=106004 RepID=A0A1Y2FL62_9BASI|nr:mitochondrial carrier domain-containing protein [Leucosporidium creatinivorum]
MTEETPPPPLPKSSKPSSSSASSTVHPPPTKADIFSLTTSAPPSFSVSAGDPRVSLRTPPPTSPNDTDSESTADGDNSGEPSTLSEFREAEDPAKRLSRLRRLFDTISMPAPSPPSSPAASTSALPEPEKDEERRLEADRKIYARELWRNTPVASAAVRWTAFERYAEEKEKELWRVFVELDVDGDMRLRKEEVREACRRAGVEVKDSMLEEFIRAVDKNNDGAISFDEWRDFLLLLPRPTSMSEIFKYYQTHRLHRPSMSRLNQDGDGASSANQRSLPRRKLVDATVNGKPPPPPVAEEDEEEEEEDELGATHGMFAGAGKFLLAGGLAGAVSRTATAPFDRLKVYLITSPSTQPPPDATPCPTGSGTRIKKPRRNAGSIPAAVRAVLKQGGGVKAFWTGNGLNVIKIFPESAIKFLSYESAKRVFAEYWDHVPDQTMISNSSRFVAGGIGGVVSQFVIYPIETLKTRVMSSTGGELKGNTLIVKTAADMWKNGGIRLYFRGLPAGLIGVFPYSAIDMSTFEGIKLAYTKWAGEEPGIPGSLAFGALSGGVGATSVYPLNLVRTRLQAQGTPAHPQTYTGVRDAAMKCYLREGWRGFYKGLTPTLVKVVPAVAISYAVYDASKKVLFGHEQDHHTAHNDDECEES